MADTILNAITDHLRKQYPQLYITQVEVSGNSLQQPEPHNVSEYTKLSQRLPPQLILDDAPKPQPHYYLYHRDGILTVLDEHFQTTYIELANPDSTTHLYNAVQRLLSNC